VNFKVGADGLFELKELVGALVWNANASWVRVYGIRQVSLERLAKLLVGLRGLRPQHSLPTYLVGKVGINIIDKSGSTRTVLILRRYSALNVISTNRRPSPTSNTPGKEACYRPPTIL
jgi:hypothetical protein